MTAIVPENNEEPKVKRKRGRPRKDEKPLFSKAKWQPKEWIPLYEEITRLSAVGVSHKELAEKYNYTVTQISNIVTQDKAFLIRGEILSNIKEAMKKNTEDRLELLAEKAVQRIEEVLFDDELAKSHPFAMADRAVPFLKVVGKLKGDNAQVNNNSVNIQQNNIINNVSVEAQDRISAGLKEIAILSQALPVVKQLKTK